MQNHNKLLARMPEVDGLKTGYFRMAGYSVAATAKKGELRLIVVVLGSPRARERDSLAVGKFKKYFSQYAMVRVITMARSLIKKLF